MVEWGCREGCSGWPPGQSSGSGRLRRGFAFHADRLGPARSTKGESMVFQPACPYTLRALLHDLKAHEIAGRLVTVRYDPDYNARGEFLDSVSGELRKLCLAEAGEFTAEVLLRLCAVAARRTGKTLDAVQDLPIAAGEKLLDGDAGKTPPPDQATSKPKQPEENVSERLPQTDAEADILKPAIAGLLRALPETWAEFEPDKLTATESTALFLLGAAGLVERRCRLRLRMLNHPTMFEATFTATGERGAPLTH